MQAMLLRIFLVLNILTLITPSLLQAATEQRTALVIGNSAYNSGPLKNPVNDAADMASMLKKLGFSVTLKRNARLQEMDEAIVEFGNRLKRGGVGLFYYAGHGVQVNGTNYLLPIGTNINKEADVKYQAVDANKILDEMATANNGLNIVMFDACRDNPFARTFRNATRGLAIVSSAPSGTLISYSTSPGNVARDGEGRNSPYTAALLKYMQTPGLTIGDMFINVRTKVKKETGQVPWELSSLEGQFFFVHGSARMSTEPSLAEKQHEPVSVEPVDELELAMAKIQRQQGDKAAQKAEREEKFRTFLADVKKYKIIAKADIDTETKAVAWKTLIRKYPAWSTDVEAGKADKFVLRALAEDTNGDLKRIAVAEGFPMANEIARDGRFIAYDNGTVLDTKTNLMWAAKDNGSNINWANAKSYCENYRGGGYSDWRMPTQDELAGLSDAGKSRPMACSTSHQIYVATELIDITCFVAWASETRDSHAAIFSYTGRFRNWNVTSHDDSRRALPVRSGK